MATKRKSGRFGELAVSRGYVSEPDVEKAVELQGYRRSKGQEVPLLGAVLEAMGRMTPAQAKSVACAQKSDAKRRRSPARSNALEPNQFSFKSNGRKTPAKAPVPPTAPVRGPRRSRGRTVRVDPKAELERLRNTVIQLQGKQTTLRAERDTALHARDTLRLELDAVTDAMIFKEDLIDRLRDQIKTLESR